MKLKQIAALFLTFGILTVFSACRAHEGSVGSAGSDPVISSDDTGRSDPECSIASAESDPVMNSDDINSIDPDEWNKEINGNRVISIYNAENREIGSIEFYRINALVSGNRILYSKSLEDKQWESTIEFWLYNIETGENRRLCAIDHIYIAYYEIIEADGHLYLSLTSGDDIFSENSRQTIYDIDLSEYSITPILQIERGVPYNSFTIADNKLILAELLYNGYTDLVEYDLNEKHDTPVVHAYDESDCFVRSSIRHIYADSNNIYMVRLDWDESDNDFLYLDIYDFDYNLLDTVDLRDFCISPTYADNVEGQMAEWRQCVSYFFVHNGLVYYENFSATRAIGTLENDKINRLFETHIEFSNVYSVSQDDSYDLFVSQYEMRNRNTFYRVDPKTHKTETAEFYADDPGYCLDQAYTNNGKLLFWMGDYVNFKMPDRFYYIDVNDLEFTPME